MSWFSNNNSRINLVYTLYMYNTIILWKERCCMLCECAHELVGWPDSLAALTERGLAFWPHDLKLVSAHVLGKCLSDCFLQLQQLSFRQSWLVTWTIAGAFSHHIDPEISFPCKLACEFTGRRLPPCQLDVLLNNHIRRLQVFLFDFWARKPRALCLAGFSISVCESS